MSTLMIKSTSTKEILNFFYAGYNFLGFLVYNSQDEVYQFGYDANSKNPRYHMESFTSLEEAYAYLEENYPDYR